MSEMCGRGGFVRLRHLRRWRRRHATLLLLCLTLVWAITVGRTSRAAVIPAANTAANLTVSALRLQTLNVFGLPWPAGNAVTPRCEAIAARIASDLPDVMALQEVWDETAREPLLLAGFHSAYCESPCGLLGQTGLLTLSRHPIVRAESRHFRAAASFEHLVQKGVLRTCIRLPDGSELDVWNVHLQSGLEQTATRMEQIEELAVWLRDLQPGTTTAVLGDFNCGPGDSDYALLELRLAAHGVRAPLCGRPTYDCTVDDLAESEPPAEIDHVFLRVPGSSTSISVRRIYDAPLSCGFASDHFGIEAVCARPGPAPEQSSH